MSRVLTLRRAAIGLIAVEVTINVLIAATGNMHAAPHHPAWVNAISQLAVVGLLALGAVVAIAARRSRFGPVLSLKRLAIAFAFLTVVSAVAAERIATDRWGSPAPAWADFLPIVSAISLGGLVMVGVARFRQRAIR